MGVVKTESINTETSQLLRDILQGKEQKLGDHIMENNNLSGLCTKDLDNNTDLMQSRYGHSPVYQNGSFSCDDSSNNSTDVGGDGDSDIDVGDFEMNDDDHENSEDNIRSNDASSNIDDSIEEDEKRFESNEAKRARVENIITGMRSTDGSEHMMYGMDVRKPKRKQYQPQQHDAKLFEHSDSKIRRTERQDMKEQLRHLKKQIYFIQKKYEDVYEDSSKTDKSVLPSVPDEPKQNSERNDYNKENSHGQQNGKSDHFEGLKIPQFDACETEITPSYILKQASKIMKDQETTRKQSFMLSGSLDKSDVAKLAKNLKEELSGAITVAVDSVVEKFLKCQAKTKQSKEVQVPPINRTPQKHFELQETRSPHLHHDFFKSLEKMSAFSPPPLSGLELPRAHAQHAPHGLHFPPPLSYYLPSQVLPPPPIFSINAEPEQTEALPLVVNTPAKKKRTKVTDTRLSPRAARALLQESVTSCMNNNGLEHHERHIPMPPYGPLSHILPTEVAIRNPDLQHSAILGCFRDPHTNHIVTSRSENSSPFRHDIGSPGHSPTGSYQASIRSEPCQEDGFDIHGMHIPFDSFRGEIVTDTPRTSTLTPMHLRKAKLMFFYVRYPSSAILKVYFPDIKFNKNNTAQLVKWFSNFREFYYIQMEKYARQAMAEGVKHIDELVVTTDSELYRVLNLHYNRNNQLEVPENFRAVVQSTLREFFKSVAGNKDTEPSWKKAIYKVIARMDDTLPEYFKSPNWMEQLGEI